VENYTPVTTTSRGTLRSTSDEGNGFRTRSGNFLHPRRSDVVRGRRGGRVPGVALFHASVVAAVPVRELRLPVPAEARPGTAQARRLGPRGLPCGGGMGAIRHRTQRCSARDRLHPACRWHLACPTGNSFSTDRLRGVSALGAIPYLGAPRCPKGAGHATSDRRSSDQRTVLSGPRLVLARRQHRHASSSLDHVTQLSGADLSKPGHLTASEGTGHAGTGQAPLDRGRQSLYSSLHSGHQLYVRRHGPVATTGNLGI
jgi:hypothetical protein